MSLREEGDEMDFELGVAPIAPVAAAVAQLVVISSVDGNGDGCFEVWEGIYMLFAFSPVEFRFPVPFCRREPVAADTEARSSSSGQGVLVRGRWKGG